MGVNIFVNNKPIIEKTPLNYTRATNPLSIILDPEAPIMEYPELAPFYKLPNSEDDFFPSSDAFRRTAAVDDEENLDDTDPKNNYPTDLKIDLKNCKFHNSPDGKQSVDVRITFTDVQGASKYQASNSAKGK